MKVILVDEKSSKSEIVYLECIPRKNEQLVWDGKRYVVAEIFWNIKSPTAKFERMEPYVELFLME